MKKVRNLQIGLREIISKLQIVVSSAFVMVIRHAHCKYFF